MKNPLRKRYIRELKSELGKFVVIFVFICFTIALISGYFVATESVKYSYDKSYERYNLEDGNFELYENASDLLIKTLEEKNVSIYKNFFSDINLPNKNILRVFQTREIVNLASVLEGNLPKNETDIAIDRLFATNNNYNVGDKIEIEGGYYKICGLIALPDYSSLFMNNNDMMFNARTFGVAVVNRPAFNNIHYSYSWKYDYSNLSEKQKRKKSDEILEILAPNVSLVSFIPELDNKGIHFAGDDFGTDEAMMKVLLYIVMVILAFIFAVTSTNTIEKEAVVIGTLRASGYTKWELVRHYLMLPVMVTIIGAIIGNILGYTVFKQMVVDLLYNSYCLPEYQMRLSAYAFVMTTIIPCVIMFVVNIIILNRKLSISPLKYLRQDLKKNKYRRAVNLPKFKFLRRFQLRVILQNTPLYLTMLFGIICANILLLFGLMMTPIMNDYIDEICDNKICDYQYILKGPVETKNSNAEKYAIKPLYLAEEKEEEVSVVGIYPESKYLFQVKAESDDIIVSDSFLEKYGYSIGSTINLNDIYETDKSYSFKITDSVYYPAAISIFMNIDTFNTIFKYEDNYFNGYFSNELLSDIDDKLVITKITEKDLINVAEQFKVSLGGIFPLIRVFSVILYMLMIYLLSKIVIERNSIMISMVKILGYSNQEIRKLYIDATAMVTIVSIIFSLPISYLFVKNIYRFMMSSITGWIRFWVSPVTFLTMFALGIVSYGFISLFNMQKVKKIPMQNFLKNSE